MVMPNVEVLSTRKPGSAWPMESAEERLSALAHEIRGRLHILTLNTDAMLTKARASDFRVSQGWLSAGLNRQATVVRSMLELMERLLDVQVAEHFSAMCTMQVVELRALVFGILQADSESLRAAGCNWSLHAPTAVAGHWDAVQLRVAVSNLVGNAIKYGSGKPVEVSVGYYGNSAFVRVTDHGVGVRTEDRERIFGRFERANARVCGSGLGLWLVRAIARAHGGEVALSSEPGLGATFTLTLAGGLPHSPSTERR